MAIYHQHIKVFTRAKGHNIVKSIAYRRGIKLIDPISGKTYDYSRKKNVIHSEIIISQNAPGWIKDLVELEKNNPVEAAQLLANSIELREKRIDAQLAREIEVALPIELTKEQNLVLCRDFIAFFVQQGMVADFNIHWETGNPHAHIIFSMRELTNDGWGKKVRGWNEKKFINQSRELWAEKTNNHLRMAELEIRVSHLSNYDLGIDQEPTVHVGNRRNSNQQARDQNNAIHLVNLNKIMDNPEIIFDKVMLQQSTFELNDLAKALGTQLDLLSQATSNTIDLGVIDLDGTAAPNLSLVPLIDQATTLPNIQEAKSPTIEILPNSTPHQIVEQVLTFINKNESVFTERYLTYVLSKHIKNPEEVAKILLEIKGSPNLMSIGFGEDGRERFTTRDLFNIENELQEVAIKLKGKAKHKVAGWLINKCLKEFKLKDDQAEAIRFILKGRDISCMVGRAGTGKSYSLKAARWAWERSGFNVYGVALAGIAAQNLEQDSGIKSQTIESFNYSIQNEKLVLSNKDVIVMDEAGMTDSISMAKIILVVIKAGAKLVLVGDHAQLQPVGPGAVFRSLLELLGFAELTTIRRQKEGWQREATFHFAAGNTEKALGFYQKHGEIYLTESRAIALELLVNDWYKAVSQSTVADHLILAYLNADVEELNQKARDKIIAEGGLPRSYVIQTNQQILKVAIGERIIFLENNWRYQVKNGQRGTITGVILDDLKQVKTIEVHLDGKQNKIISIDPEKYNKFSYGYACTVHKSQGVTVENSFVLAFGRWCKNLTYVAMTRHKGSAKIYASEETYKTVEELKKGLSKDRLKDSILDYPEAFAQRRGIDSQEPNNIVLLQRHIVKKLKVIKQKFADTYERLITPQVYLDRIVQQNKVAKILQRREDAKLVAAYVDAHCQVGKAWGECKASNNHIEYQQILNQAQILRNSIAAKICAEPAKYTLAMEIYELKLENLEKQAKNYKRYLRVQDYLDKSKSSMILRDKLAYEIEQEIKAHYPYLKDENIDTKQLAEHAKEHRRRMFLLKLSLEQRKAFKQVEEYLKLSKKAAELWGKYKTNHKIVALTEKQQISKSLGIVVAINQERDRLAYAIKQEQSLYQVALDYFEFGAVSRVGSNNYLGLSLVELPRDEQSLCNAVAVYLGQDVKTFMSTVATMLNIETNQLADLDLGTLSKLLNRPIITIGANGKVADPEVLTGASEVEPIFVHYDHIYKGMVLDDGVTYRQVLAKLQQEMKLSEWQDNRLARLEKQAKNYKRYLRVQDYLDKSKNSMILRDKLAYEIEQELKAHYPYLKKENINTKQLVEQAKEHRKRIFLLKLSLAERKAFKEVEAYLKLSKKAAKLWEQKREGSISEWVLRKGLKLNRERDFLAYTIKQKLALYKAALDYFEIGNLETTISEAKMRCLETRALEFERKRNLQENIIKFKKNVGNLPLRRLIAKDLVVTPKYYHMAKDAKINLNLLWKLAKYQQKIELLGSLSPIEQAACITAINYKQKRREAGALWGEIFAQKNQGVQVDQKLFEKAKSLNAKRDELAYLIEQNFERHHRFLLAEKVQTKDLKNHAKSYQKQLKLQPARNLERLVPSATFNYAHSLEQLYLKPKGFTEEQLEKQKYAQLIVNRSIPIDGTLAETYLKEHRGLTGEASEKVFMFNPKVKEQQTQKEWPALVVIARGKQQEVQSVQCIYLDPETSNQLKVAVPKRTYGPQEGAKILVQHCKFVPNAYHNYALTYGPETALSIAEADRDLGVYLTLAANFANVPISTGCKDILLCVDQDGIDSFANQNLDHAIQALAERGLNVYCARPTDVKDFNDVMKIHGALRVKQLLDDKKLVKEALTMEQLIENKEKLVSDYAKVMVDFVVKYQAYQDCGGSKSVEEVKYKHDLFKQVGEVSVFIKNNGIFAEICERHQLEEQVSKIEEKYIKVRKIEMEVEHILKELGTEHPIEDYIKVLEEKGKLPDLADNLQEKKTINDLTEQAGKLAYVIQNTPTLQYQVKDLPFYRQIEDNAAKYQQQIAMANEINLDLGYGWGDD